MRLGLPHGRGPVLVAVAALLAGGLALGSLPTPVAEPVPAATSWQVEDALLGEAGGRLDEGQPWVGTVPVRALRLREVTAVLTWEDDVPASAPDEFTLELVPPPGLYAGPVAEGKGGRLEVVVPVQALPPEGPPTLGVGGWKVRAYLRSAGDGTTLGVLPGAMDEGNEFRLEVWAQVFTPRAVG